MHITEAFLDANLLVLLVVGAVDRRLVSTHHRTREFTRGDYDRLCRVVEGLKVFVTPNTLTETSNLLMRRPRDPRFLDKLRILVQESKEITVASATAAVNNAFSRLGLTDAALLEVISERRPLITVDLELFSAAVHQGEMRAINFTHYREF